MRRLRDAPPPEAPPTHLGVALTGLVDGSLDHQARERALAHLAHCEPCRVEADGLRRLRAHLLALGTTTPAALPPGLTERLLALGAPAPLRPAPVLAPGPAGTRRPAGSPAGTRRPQGHPRVSRPRLPRAAAAGAALVLGLGGVLALGSPPSRPSRPVLEPAGNVQQVDLSRTEPALTVRPAGR